MTFQMWYATEKMFIKFIYICDAWYVKSAALWSESRKENCALQQLDNRSQNMGQEGEVPFSAPATISSYRRK